MYRIWFMREWLYMKWGRTAMNKQPMPRNARYLDGLKDPRKTPQMASVGGASLVSNRAG